VGTLAADFLAWGWRIPFLLSALPVGLGLYIRVSVAETPVFTDVAEKRKPLKAPVVDAIRRHPRSFLVVIGSRLAENALVVQQLQLPSSEGLFGVILSQFLSLATIPLFSALSDRVGRKPVYLGAALFSAAWAFPFFLLCETKAAWAIWLAFIGASAIGVSGMFGPQAAYYSELFGPRVRYGGFAFARELGSILADGPAVPRHVAANPGRRQAVVGRGLYHRAVAAHGARGDHRPGNAQGRYRLRASRRRGARLGRSRN